MLNRNSNTQDNLTISQANVVNLVNDNPCYYHEPELVSYQTTEPRKNGDMVYVLSKEHQTICIIDALNKVSTLDLAAGNSQSVYGRAPFTVISSDLTKFDLYFQGWKVKNLTPNARAIRLEESPIASN